MRHGLGSTPNVFPFPGRYSNSLWLLSRLPFACEFLRLRDLNWRHLERNSVTTKCDPSLWAKRRHSLRCQKRLRQPGGAKGCGIGLDPCRVAASELGLEPSADRAESDALDHPSFSATAGARSSAVLWPSANTIAMATIASAAMRRRPPVKLPVASLIQPIA